MSGCSSGVEHNLAKVGVEGSNPFARSSFLQTRSIYSASLRGPMTLNVIIRQLCLDSLETIFHGQLRECPRLSSKREGDILSPLRRLRGTYRNLSVLNKSSREVIAQA